MQFLDLTLPTLEENLALDEALLQAAEAAGGAEFLRLWESSQYGVVLGRNCRLSQDVWTDRCLADDVALQRRVSGGGTVLLGPGCLNYSLVLRYDRAPDLESVPHAFDYVLRRMQFAIGTCKLECRVVGTDLVVGDRKIGGSAQRRQHTHLLHHGTILYSFELTRIPRYLREPPRQPEHRKRRDHLSFVINLPVSVCELRKAIVEVWNADPAGPFELEDQVATLVAQRYADARWVQRL